MRSAQHRSNSASTLWQSPDALGAIPQSRVPPTHNLPLHAQRRGSLPVSVTADNAIRGPQLDHLGRRLSVDTSVLRLASHPYAQAALAKNGALYPPSISRFPSQLRLSSQPESPLDNPPPSVNSRPTMYHRGSLPHEHMNLNLRHRASFDSRGYHYPNGGPPPSSPSPLSFHNPNIRFNGSRYAVPIRTISSPIPGPLPQPDFSFGAPSLTPPTNSPSPGLPNCDSPESLSTVPGYGHSRSDDPDTEDDGTSASYDAISRFGSIASLAGSESSSTSAYYSDVSSTDVGQDMRRGSWCVLLSLILPHVAHIAFALN
jgi:hypothetical protein